MNRGFIIASVLIAAAAAAFSMRACASAKEAPATVAAAPAAAASVSQWQPGLNYDVLAYPQPTNVPKGKVEVNEIFWYGCGHCYALDPFLETWKKKNKPEFIEFIRIPVIWGSIQRQHAKLFYTLQKLGRLDLHAKVFNSIHQAHNPLAGRTDAEGRALQLAFLAENGVPEKDFNAAYDSPEVEANIDAAQKLTGRYEVGSVPTMIVAGQYSTSVSQAGGNTQLLALITDLATREQRR